MLTFSQAVAGYLVSAKSRRLSPNTLIDYATAHRQFAAHLIDDRPLDQITASDVSAFMASLTVGKKTVLNRYTSLSALWTWAVQKGIVTRNIVREIRPPNPPDPIIEPFTRHEITAMLSVLDRSRRHRRKNHVKEFIRRIHTGTRNRAIILTLLDTGLRASELCDLNVEDTDLKALRVTVRHGKGDKTRVVPIDARVAESIWDYLSTRSDVRDGHPLFVSGSRNRLHRRELHQLIARIGARAGVRNAYPHRFRHTFAIEFLRHRRGDVFTLQEILGHSDLTMVRRYVRLAEVDIAEAHRDASPVARWNL